MIRLSDDGPEAGAAAAGGRAPRDGTGQRDLLTVAVPDARPLADLRVIEVDGIGPVPYAAMLLAGLGAEVTRIRRPEPPDEPLGRRSAPDAVLRGRGDVVLDLKGQAGRDGLLGLVADADVLLEGFRPGVMERLRLGPDECHLVNPSLVYVRVTGWGQTGPLAARAGHDINFIAVTGLLDAMRRGSASPTIPLNVVGDYAGGSLFALVGILGGLWQLQRSGSGTVVDVAMVDGVASLLQNLWSLRDGGKWPEPPGFNLLDGGAPFYDTYVCADETLLAVGALEPRFWAELVDALQLDPQWLDWQYDQTRWQELRALLARTFRRHTRPHWLELMRDRDGCISPVLTLAEARLHPHAVARRTHHLVDGAVHTAPVPRFGRAPAS